jgi:hypothetical protein
LNPWRYVPANKDPTDISVGLIRSSARRNAKDAAYYFVGISIKRNRVSYFGIQFSFQGAADMPDAVLDCAALFKIRGAFKSSPHGTLYLIPAAFNDSVIC